MSAAPVVIGTLLATTIGIGAFVAAVRALANYETPDIQGVFDPVKEPTVWPRRTTKASARVSPIALPSEVMSVLEQPISVSRKRPARGARRGGKKRARITGPQIEVVVPQDGVEIIELAENTPTVLGRLKGTRNQYKLSNGTYVHLDPNGFLYDRYGRLFVPILEAGQKQLKGARAVLVDDTVKALYLLEKENDYYDNDVGIEDFDVAAAKWFLWRYGTTHIT